MDIFNYKSPAPHISETRFGEYYNRLVSFTDLDKVLGGYSNFEKFVLKKEDIIKIYTPHYLEKIVPEKISSSVMDDISHYIRVNRFTKDDCYFLLSNLEFHIKRFGERQIELYSDKIATTSKLNKSKIQLYEETIKRIMETRSLLINKYDTYMLKYDNEKDITLVENKFDNVLPEIVVQYFKKHLLTTGYLEKLEFIYFLKHAFEEPCSPPQKLTLKGRPTKTKITGIFYHYYINIAGKPFGKQKDYADLLENYFIGYSSISSNFTKGTTIKE